MKVMLSNSLHFNDKYTNLKKGNVQFNFSTGLLYLASMLGRQKKLGLSKIADVILEEIPGDKIYNTFEIRY